MASLYALDLRVRIAVDAAGSGYAGLAHILAVRPHVVKLDQVLVRSVDLDLARQALVGAMVGFAARTGATVVAEGIETAGEAATLRELGAQLGQGYFFGRPERAPEPAATAIPN
jgi:EAL domain-containing protein (putative c-di-GMP-specific phosphodiesterase class I)